MKDTYVVRKEGEDQYLCKMYDGPSFTSFVLKGDEYALAHELLHRIVMGRKVYGPWTVEDQRDLDQEELEELQDAMVYRAMRRVRERRSR